MLGRGGDEGGLTCVREGDLVRFVDVILGRLRDDEVVTTSLVSISWGEWGVGGGRGTVCLAVVLCEVVEVVAAVGSGCGEVRYGVVG